MILLIDNYDSFTYNIVQMLEDMGQEVKVIRNDQIDIPGIEALNPSVFMVSPGPGRPADAGISLEAIKALAPKIPILGVCLGHQTIAEAFGGKIVRAKRIMHGKSSRIFHDGKGLYRDLPNPFDAIRYHSLIVERESLPDCFEISAWTERGEIMGLRHKEHQVEGMQFHPESILTDAGPSLLKNFSDIGCALTDPPACVS
ncbi:MAG: aminodeoxychorismate/anthranilate synthase component II [Deltaproteobacteria bacterium]|nr:aminodeoxychorismate/anthranilate synthase component II [Deltaproteobacteria bacterium]MBW1913333.1 aminodeoxychorismate/anthranilate synthase component II [Deltaproteobacteria bacterium]